LPDEWRDWAISEEKLPLELAEREGKKFADYWKAQPGNKARKANWPATWRNWVRRSTEMGGKPSHGRPTPASEQQKPDGMPDHVWRKIQEDVARAATQAPTQRFNPDKIVLDVHGILIKGEDANDMLDEVPGATYDQIRKALKNASGQSKTRFSRCDIYTGNYKPNLLDISGWVVEKVWEEVAIATHGSVEKLAGGPIARIGDDPYDALKSRYVALSEGFIERMRKAYPLAMKEGFCKYEDPDAGHRLWGGGIWTGFRGAHELFRELISNEYNRVSWSKYGPELQGEFEKKFEERLKEREETVAKVEKANAEWRVRRGQFTEAAA
jgi:hypothetical protein